MEGLYQQYGEDKLHFIGAITNIDDWDDLNGSSWRTAFNVDLTYFLSTKSEFNQYESTFSVAGHPHNVLIGKDYKVTHIIGGWSAEMIDDAIADAMELMTDMHICHQISDVLVETNSTTQFDLSEVFSSSSNYDFSIEAENSNPDAITVTVADKTITIVANSVVKNCVITLTAASDTDTESISFTVIVNKPGITAQMNEDFEDDVMSDFWSFEGNKNWTLADNGNGGGKCAKSGSIGHNQHSTLVVEHEFNQGASVQFDRKVSTELDFDYFEFYIDTERKARWSGELDWETTGYFAIPEGTHTVKWKFIKDGGAVGGSDCVWLDNVKFIFDGTEMGIDSDGITPVQTSLYQNYPNPFNPSTTISFENATAGNVKLSVFNIKGELVRTLINGNMSAAAHKVNFNAANLNSGVYYYTLETSAGKMTKKMLLVK